jgi:hypothetical protein
VAAPIAPIEDRRADRKGATTMKKVRKKAAVREGFAE